MDKIFFFFRKSRKNAILTYNLFGFCLQISVQENYESSGETVSLRYSYKKWALEIFDLNYPICTM